ncbi:MAG: hypothetical protein K6G19_08995 [Lachnospiraceae bacterium]|nr:hypothetical protein [Lachnospiraceae bacterium]
MDKTGISNVKRINMAYDSVEKRLNGIVDGLKEDYEEFTKGNVYYRKVSGGSIFLSILIDIILFVAMFYLRVVSVSLQSRLGYNYTMPSGFQSYFCGKDNVLGSIISIILLITFLYSVYATAIKIYCKKLERYSKRIDKVSREVASRISIIRSAQLRQDIIGSAARNEEYAIASNNDLGSEIASIRDGFINTNQKAHTVKKIISIGVSAVAFLALLLYLLIKVKPNVVVMPNIGLSLMMLYILAAAVVNLTQLCAGEYMGKFSKIIGAVMAIIYGLVLMMTIKDAITFPAFEIQTTGFLSLINQAFLAIPLLQIIGIVLTVILSHYGLEQEKWRNGFSVSMSYGSKDNGNKVTMLIRGGLAFLLSVLMCVLCAVTTVTVSSIKGFFCIIIVGVLWYASNSILKPRGSYLYTFWGRGRAIANEFVMAAMLLTSIICSRGTVSVSELIALCIAFIVSFVVAIIAKVINDNVF